MAIAQERDFYNEAVALLRTANAASLATAQDNVPFAALVTFALLADLSPVMLLSTLSGHTRQLKRNPACSLLVVGPALDANPQTAPRLCVTGTAAISDEPSVRAAFMAAHPYASQYADFADFAFWRMDITAAQYVGGFAAAARLDIEKLKAVAKNLP
ncbi:MAG: pyridoxamine 5'-phosphate oxidase family protein [Acidocella sp.]|nr:pyridoxamine 5'-phosphate oxidase family protein [Acidocella sp.]